MQCNIHYASGSQVECGSHRSDACRPYREGCKLSMNGLMCASDLGYMSAALEGVDSFSFEIGFARNTVCLLGVFVYLNNVHITNMLITIKC